MKRLITMLLLGISLLTGCGGGNSGDIGNETQTIKKVPIQLNVPKAWREVRPEDLKNQTGDIVLSYAGLNYTNGFANNITVTREVLKEDVTSLQYAQANLVNSAKFLQDYLKLDDKEVMIQDVDNNNIPTRLHTFEARLDQVERKRKYIQLYASYQKTGYTITIAVPLDETDLGKYENLIRSFRFVKE